MNKYPVTAEDDSGQNPIPIPITYSLLPTSVSGARISSGDIIVPLKIGRGPSICDWTISRTDAYGLIDILRDQLKQE